MKLNFPNIFDTDIRFSHVNLSPEVEEQLKMALSFIIGQDKTTNKFHFLSVDSDGNLKINLSASSPDTFTVTSTTVTNTAAAIATTDSTRLGLLVQNTDTSPIAVSSNSGVTFSTGMIIQGGATFDFKDYVGNLYAISQAGNVTVLVIEET